MINYNSLTLCLLDAHPTFPRLDRARLAQQMSLLVRRRAVQSFLTRALPLESAYDVAGDSPAIDVEVADRAELDRVRKAIARLTGNLREIIVLRGIEELSQAETAQMLGVSEKSVETSFYAAHDTLSPTVGK